MLINPLKPFPVYFEKRSVVAVLFEVSIYVIRDLLFLVGSNIIRIICVLL